MPVCAHTIVKYAVVVWCTTAAPTTVFLRFRIRNSLEFHFSFSPVFQGISDFPVFVMIHMIQSLPSL